MMAVKRIKHDDMMEVTWGKRVAIDRIVRWHLQGS